MNDLSVITAVDAIPAILARASSTLDAAKSSAEILEARDTAAFAYDAAKSAARINRAKGAHDDLVQAAHRLQGEALRIDARAKYRLAEEYDAAQERGEVASGRPKSIPGENSFVATTADIGLTSKDIFEARQVRDAEAKSPGIVNDAISALVDAGKEPTRTAVRRAIIKSNNVGLAAFAPAIPDGKFSVIVIDPPWQMEKIERDVRPNQAALDYPTMDEDELITFGEIIEQMSADDCHLFMWTTQKFMPLALDLVASYGFRYVLQMVWHKPGGFQPIGLPQYNCEFVIYARRGAPKFFDTKAFPCCFEAPRREHSRKPDEFYDTVRRVTGGQRIDVFSREARPGFEQFGNESNKFDEAA